MLENDPGYLSLFQLRSPDSRRCGFRGHFVECPPASHLLFGLGGLGYESFHRPGFSRRLAAKRIGLFAGLVEALTADGLLAIDGPRVVSNWPDRFGRVSDEWRTATGNRVLDGPVDG